LFWEGKKIFFQLFSTLAVKYKVKIEKLSYFFLKGWEKGGFATALPPQEKFLKKCPVTSGKFPDVTRKLE